MLPFTDDPNSTIEAAEKYLREAGLTHANDNLVVLSDLRADNAQVDSIQVRQAKGVHARNAKPVEVMQESMMD